MSNTCSSCSGGAALSTAAKQHVYRIIPNRGEPVDESDWNKAVVIHAEIGGTIKVIPVEAK